MSLYQEPAAALEEHAEEESHKVCARWRRGREPAEPAEGGRYELLRDERNDASRKEEGIGNSGESMLTRLSLEIISEWKSAVLSSLCVAEL